VAWLISASLKEGLSPTAALYARASRLNVTSHRRRLPQSPIVQMTIAQVSSHDSFGGRRNPDDLR